MEIDETLQRAERRFFFSFNHLDKIVSDFRANQMDGVAPYCPQERSSLQSWRLSRQGDSHGIKRCTDSLDMPC